MAVAAYKFYCTAKCSDEILNFYIENLEKSVFSIEIPEQPSNDSICITLPEIEPNSGFLDIAPNICTSDYSIDLYGSSIMEPEVINQLEIKKSSTQYKDDDNVVVIVAENGERMCYKVGTDNMLELVPKKKVKNKMVKIREGNKLRKKRDPMVFRKCSKCPVKYRFIAKLKEHMKIEHNIDLYCCKVSIDIL